MLTGVGGGVAVQSASADTYTPISGSGSTWSQNALDQWRKNVASNYGMTVNYSGSGSSAGRADFIAGTVDFAVSEIPFQAKPEDGSAPEAPATPYAYMPIVAGGTSFMYNLKIGGKRVTNLRLSGDVITKIFTGVISKWNDPAIQTDNPGLAMPDKSITPVVRSDGSGSTAQFTLWMSKQHPDLWNAFCTSVKRSVPCGLTSQYPEFSGSKAQSGSLGVSGYVSQDYGEGAITYVEYSYALKSGFPVAKVLNSAGYYVEPTAPSVAVALLSAQINTTVGSPDYLTQILDGVYNSADARTYPLSSYSYMIVPTKVGGVFTAEKGKTLGVFTNYLLCEGQQQAAALGYSPLPLNLVQAASDQIKKIPGASTAGVNLATCNNPTFDGKNPASNKLADTAPQPQACDQRGPNQCVTGTGGATATTDVSGSGSGGAAAALTTTTDTAASAVAPAAATAADPAVAAASNTAVYDANGSVVSGATSGSAVAVSKPLALSDTGFGAQQIVMTVAGALLLIAIVLPPLLSRRLKRNSPR
ncbi:phosphate ABC transporter substrate-binding protein PstS [Subtercola vilae]|uniref:Phosphate ABC transporter substrate-binding protein PstS n=2 Tax=Subtercola vilae TaxID=2056433 RepID=A0A4T2BPC2_9MICO|nr:phosphate ABC transporter substrate-binding protein PstS [Subtercola vilae]